MTNAERAELKMWIRRLESAKRAIAELVPDNNASTHIDDAVCCLERTTKNEPKYTL